MFKEIAADSRSKNSRRKIHGVGINDADYFTQYKGVSCPYYHKWKKMLERCYSDKWKKNKPTYSECVVCVEWLTFSNFKEWMLTQDWVGKELDKDIIFSGNKVYSPDACIFVSREINLLIQHKKSKFATGVNYHKRDKVFCTAVSHNGSHDHIGSYRTEMEAHDAYKIRKYEIIKEVAMLQSEPLKSALLNHRIEVNNAAS